MAHIPTKWAERKDKLYITIQASGATNVDVKFTEKTVSVTGSGITPKAPEPHELKDQITLFKEIIPEKSTFNVTGVGIRICAMKKDEGYWNKLVDLPNKQTMNWLSVDWNLWKDEDEEDDAPAGFGDYGDLSQMMNMGGMGGMGGMGDSDDEDEDGEDGNASGISEEQLKDLDA